jgi:hypothetical protein
MTIHAVGRGQNVQPHFLARRRAAVEEVKGGDGDRT